MKKLTIALTITFILVVGIFSVEASCIEVPVEVATSVHIDPNGGHPIWKPPAKIGAGIPGRYIRISGPPEVVLHVPAEWDGQSVSLNLVAELDLLYGGDPSPGEEYRFWLEIRDPLDGTMVETLEVFVLIPDPWNAPFKVDASWDGVSGLVAGETYLISPIGEDVNPVGSRVLAALAGGVKLCFSTGMQ